MNERFNHNPENTEEQIIGESDVTRREFVESALPTREDKETAGKSISSQEKLHPNRRIAILMAQLHEAELNLRNALLDMETREQSPAFQKAKELYENGWRLEENVDTDGEISDLVLYRAGTPVTQRRETTFSYHIADREHGVLDLFQATDDGESVEFFWNVIGTENASEIVDHLTNLTHESPQT